MKQGDTFANRLALLRHQKGMNQEEFAKLVSDMSNRKKSYSILSVSGWESGDKYPPLPVVLYLCDYFNVTSDYLLGRSDDPGNTTIVSATVTDAQGQHKPNYLVTYNDLQKFDGEPIYVVFNDKKAANRWGIMDSKKNRIVFSGSYLNVDRNVACTYYTHIPDEEKVPRYNLRKSLSMKQIMKSEKIWIEMISADDQIKGRYNGWFKHNENNTNLVNSVGLTLPYEGLSISYNAYSSEF